MNAGIWAGIAYGSIHHGLGKMADEGLLEIADIHGQGAAHVHPGGDDDRGVRVAVLRVRADRRPA
jgi:hypothetical protein